MGWMGGEGKLAFPRIAINLFIGCSYWTGFALFLQTKKGLKIFQNAIDRPIALWWQKIINAEFCWLLGIDFKGRPAWRMPSLQMWEISYLWKCVWKAFEVVLKKSIGSGVNQTLIHSDWWLFQCFWNHFGHLYCRHWSFPRSFRLKQNLISHFPKDFFFTWNH